MGECCSTQVNLVNELSTFLILDEGKITTIQASIRRHLYHKTHHAQNCTLRMSEDIVEVNSHEPEKTHNELQKVQNYEFPNGIYTGSLCKCCNIMNGVGKFIYHDKSCYDGEWINGKAFGQGTMTYANGDVYEGNWKEDQVNGFGKYTRKNGASYYGEWKDDQQNGFGTEKWPDGSMYEGSFIMGRKEGKGKFVWADRSCFEGEFKNNLIDGHGAYKWPNGRKYIGCVKRNKIHAEAKHQSIRLAHVKK